jgi:hypothetical protein
MSNFINLPRIPGAIAQLTGKHLSYLQCYNLLISGRVPSHCAHNGRLSADPLDIIKHYKIDMLETKTQAPGKKGVVS